MEDSTKEPMISFMINVAWGNQFLLELLKILEISNVRATFMLAGSWVQRYSSLAIKIRDNGHEIGNHAYSHPDMRGLSSEDILWELRKTNAIILKKLGISPEIFSPPAGEFDERVVRLALGEGLRTILYTIDTIDWDNPQPEALVARVKAKLKNGAIILMHPTKVMLNVFPEMINEIKAKGYKLASISEVLAERGGNYETICYADICRWSPCRDYAFYTE